VEATKAERRRVGTHALECETGSGPWQSYNQLSHPRPVTVITFFTGDQITSIPCEHGRFRMEITLDQIQKLVTP
jgi:hypothetical protein